MYGNDNTKWQVTPAIDLINPEEYDMVVTKLREFFRSKKFIEVPTQHRLSILAACEDPSTIGSYSYAGSVWPLPQTGQMWLEYELLKNPQNAGYYCISTSYRNEPNPIPGRHNLIFPMFEFETHGNMDTLKELEGELLEFLGFGEKGKHPELTYTEAAKKFELTDLKAEHEMKLYEEYGPAVFLTHFPQYTSPFWNMKKVDDIANKIDVLLYGIETIGSAERSSNPYEMREMFHTISNGMYAGILFAQFGRQRVEKELEEFLSFDFFPRVGGGIGVTRMIRAFRMQKYALNK